MTAYYFKVLLVRLVLPAAMLLSMALRPFGVSVIYLFLFIMSPLVRTPTRKTFSGMPGRFLLIVSIISTILLFSHVAWHVVLAVFSPYGSMTKRHSTIEKIAHNLGFVAYVKIELKKAIQLVSPEIIMTAVSTFVHQIVKRLVLKDADKNQKDSKYQRFPVFVSAGRYICLLLIMFSGVMVPSVTSAIYYLAFLTSATLWSLGNPLEKGFAVVNRCLMAIMSVHVLVLFAYQCTYVMELYPPDRPFARYFGLTQFVDLNITNSFQYHFYHDGHMANLFNPLVILITYYVLAVESKELFKPKVAFPYISSKVLRGNASETTPLIRSRSPGKRWPSIRTASSQLHQQDSTGSVILDDSEVINEEPTLLDDIIAAVIDFFQVVVRSSYIATTITMMAWSIMFHSWLTFVLLMWANVVWMCPNQRSFMLRTSPVLVCYAIFLLVSQYIYGINLSETELPSNMTAPNLQQIGLGRKSGEPCVPLLIKSMFTCMFWVTLRQRVQELRARRQAAALADMAAPLQLTVTASVISVQPEEEYKSRLMQSFGKFVRAACARYWIYLVVIMLFVIGITGKRMTMFRIVYMFLFLVFILMFQFSWYWWRRLTFVFWIVVITYSMANLILLYIYQFDYLPKALEEYLMIDPKLQHDLGLEPYDPADLFVKLLTPTCFLIMTVMQVHYFHKDFMELSDTRSSGHKNEPSESDRQSPTGASTIKEDEPPPLPLEDENRTSSIFDPDHSLVEKAVERDRSLTDKSGVISSYVGSRRPRRSLRHGWRNWLERDAGRWKNHFMQFLTTLFIVLDIHLNKIIFLSVLLLCVFNPCAMHVPLMVIISPGLLLGAKKQRVCILVISTLISIYLMAQMVYQIEYIKHDVFNVNCSLVADSGEVSWVLFHNAEWIGFQKTSDTLPLPSYIKGYIALVALFTFRSLVYYRQAHRTGRSQSSMKLMFPGIKREDADKDLIHCLKYLCNYGFYKFGVEISLICMMGVIGSRMDFYALVYAIWLFVLISMKRPSQAKLWKPFTAFITIIVPFQYILAIGFLPQFCIQYPWGGSDSVRMKHVRNWLFLPYSVEPPHATKIIFDYLLLLFASRQVRVFWAEKHKKDEYEGGSNQENVGEEWETPNFINPVPDFLGFVGTWLDVVKRLVFLGMLWVTLAIMFMTGTNRVNLFSMGYLVGSFLFLWQGTDYYLLPKESILRWWSWLLRYNVSVVVIKTLLQIPGCIFTSVMQEHACWLVQLLGIGCVDKFAGGNIAQFLKMNYVKASSCSVPQEDIGLAWDGVCFAFLILQRRLFMSYYFYRVIDDSKATTILASRGAELIEELRLKQMKAQEQQEIEILEKIKVKMERIKANQKKVQGINSKEPVHHDAEEDEEDDDETQQGELDEERLVRGESGESGASARGFHTPDSPASPRGFHTPLSEPSAPPSPARTPPPAPPPALPPPPGSHGAPPSPSSALMTASLSLDAYLEPRRISFESPPSSDLLPRAQSPEESYPVFSPPPIRRRHTVASPSLLQRTSIISQSSRAEPNSHHTFRDHPVYRLPTSHQRAIRSGDYYMFVEFDDTEEPIAKSDDDESDEDIPKQMGLGKLVATAIKTDLRHAVNLRRASAPAIRSHRHPSLTSRPFSYAQEILTRRQSRSKQADSGAAPSGSGIAIKSSEHSSTDLIQPEDENAFDMLHRFAETAWAFIASFLVSLTRHLMRYSRDYRYVSRTLTLEKKKIKEKKGFGIGLREGSQMRWEPLPETVISEHRKLSEISVPEIRILAPSMERGLDESPPSSRQSTRSSSPTLSDDDTSEHESAFSLESSRSKDVSVLEEQDDSMFKHERSPIILLLYALWYAVLAHTDIVCYVMVFINQIQSATILSIPLPLMVFLWGTLTIPRPTKTFWVTLIAYTEVIVLIKSMFQFEILPWNQKVIPANMPFTAPRIIGIERKPNYALYDLLLLLIIFLHRYMLKSLGLWKETSPEIELRKDKEFPCTPEDTKMLVEGRDEEVGRKYLKLNDQSGPETQNDGPNDGNQSAQVRGTREEPPGSSKSLEDDHYKVNDDEEPIIEVTTTLEDVSKNYPQVICLSIKRYIQPGHQFFLRMLEPGARVTADIYAYMFLCDFFNFLVVIFGFAAFGTHQGDGGVKAYLEENKVPIPFLVMLILQFALIVIDRALYLRKFILGKILFQYALIIGVHIWMFFILPFITERTFNALLPPPMWYMMKCIYLLLSAYQIRCGYPRRIIGNFLCKSYSFLNMLLFRGFMLVPFVFELRTLMDWIWTDTSMTLLDWLKMEDIFANVFLLKCSRYCEDEYPAPRGQKKSTASKYMLGGAVLAFVIAIIWFPLVFFAFGNSVGVPNPPTDVTVKIRIGPFLPVYQMSAQSHNIDLYTEQDYTQLSNMYARDRTAQTFLANYMYNDVAVVTLIPNSTMKWEISPPELDRLEIEAASNATLKVKFTFVITHLSNAAQNPPTIEDSREVSLDPFLDGDVNQRNPQRKNLHDMLTNTASNDTWLTVQALFPKFLKVFNKGEAKPAYQLTPPASEEEGENDDPESRMYRNVQLRLERHKDAMYWRVKEGCTPRDPLQPIPMNNCNMLIMYTFNDKLFPKTLNFISGSGIIGLYTTFVFLASRVIRGFFSGIYTKIMFDDLPNVDRVLQLCLDIYLVREALELSLEEDLFAKLVFLYRSPETLIKWTRPKEVDDNEEQRALPPSR